MTAAEAIVEMLGSAGDSPRREVMRAAAWAARPERARELLDQLAQPVGLAAKWLRAQLVEKLDGPKAALPLWELAVADDGREIADVLLQRARILARSGELPEAAQLLRRALDSLPPYDFFVRAENLAKRCREVYAVLDATKWGQVGLASFAYLEDLDFVITDSQPPADVCRMADAHGIKIIVG